MKQRGPSLNDRCMAIRDARAHRHLAWHGMMARLVDTTTLVKVFVPASAPAACRPPPAAATRHPQPCRCPHRRAGHGRGLDALDPCDGRHIG